jgi:hypothetical protein
MGAQSFYNRVKSTNASVSFSEEVEQACYDYGNDGYTGTIAEKDSYTESSKPSQIGADEWIDLLEGFDDSNRGQEHFRELRRDATIYHDKWGDALCIKTKTGFIFCGYASC